VLEELTSLLHTPVLDLRGLFKGREDKRRKRKGKGGKRRKRKGVKF